MFKIRYSFQMILIFFYILFGPAVFIAEGQEFPVRPVTFIVPYAPGGATDSGVRILANVAKKYLGQSIIVESKLGASGQIGADYLARQKPDGYTIGQLTYPQTHGEYFRYFRESTSTSKDFKAVAQWTMHTGAVVVKADDPFNNLKDLADYAKKNPGLVYSPGGGKGTLFHVAMTIFEEVAGIKLVDIPLKGEGEVIPQILGGHLRVGVVVLATCIPFIKAGKLKSIAIIADDRFADYPSIPTFKEQGYHVGFGDTYVAAHVPAKTPEPIVAKLREVIKKTCQDKEFISAMKPVGTPVVYRDGEAMENKVNEITAAVVKVFKQFGYLK